MITSQVSEYASKIHNFPTIETQKTLKKVKACVHYFVSIFVFFTPNESPLKTIKNVFYFN